MHDCITQLHANVHRELIAIPLQSTVDDASATDLKLCTQTPRTYFDTMIVQRWTERREGAVQCNKGVDDWCCRASPHPYLPTDSSRREWKSCDPCLILNLSGNIIHSKTSTLNSQHQTYSLPLPCNSDTRPLSRVPTPFFISPIYRKAIPLHFSTLALPPRLLPFCRAIFTKDGQGKA